MKNRRPLLALGVIVVVAALTMWGVASRSETPPAPGQGQSQVKSTPVVLRIPGEKPISALTEDYLSPDSLWVVVSKQHPLAEPHYRPVTIEKPPVAVNESKSLEEQSLRSDVKLPVEQLFAAAKTAGFDFMIASGYRSYDLQQTYFSNYSAQYGEAAANKFSAKPGQSEHQTGLGLDISLTSRECYLDTCFGDLAAGKWLAAHAHEYGFILRYPADKTAITEYQYEPWHFRYVGSDLAGALHSSGFTLDEAYPHLQKTRDELKKSEKI